MYRYIQQDRFYKSKFPLAFIYLIYKGTQLKSLHTSFSLCTISISFSNSTLDLFLDVCSDIKSPLSLIISHCAFFISTSFNICSFFSFSEKKKSLRCENFQSDPKHNQSKGTSINQIYKFVSL